MYDTLMSCNIAFHLQLLLTCMLQPRLSSHNPINMFQSASVEPGTGQYVVITSSLQASSDPVKIPFHLSLRNPTSKLSGKVSVTFLRVRLKSGDPTLLHLLSERAHAYELESL